MFTLGKFLIGLYLGRSSVASVYGAAGSLVVLLLWIYYSAQVFLLGAEFTQVYARRWGSRIPPARGDGLEVSLEVCSPSGDSMRCRVPSTSSARAWPAFPTTARGGGAPLPHRHPAGAEAGRCADRRCATCRTSDWLPPWPGIPGKRRSPPARRRWAPAGDPDLHANLARVHTMAGDPVVALRRRVPVWPSTRAPRAAIAPAHGGAAAASAPALPSPQPPRQSRAGRLRASLGAQEKAPPARSERGLPPLMLRRAGLPAVAEQRP
jgi:hypothetical protein